MEMKADVMQDVDSDDGTIATRRVKRKATLSQQHEGAYRDGLIHRCSTNQISSKKRPSWLRVTPRSTKPRHKRATMQEIDDMEYMNLNRELRLRALHYCDEVVDSIYKDSLDDTHIDMFSELRDFLSNSIEGDSVMLAILRTAMVVDDRRNAIHAFRRYLLKSNMKSGDDDIIDRKNSAVCIIRAAACTNLSDVVWEVVKQCEALETVMKSKIAVNVTGNNKTDMKMKASVDAAVEALLLWTGQCTQYDHIIILFEDAEAFTAEKVSFRSVISLLSSSLREIPISAVIAIPPGVDEYTLSSVPNSYWMCVRRRFFSFPNPFRIFDRIVEGVMIGTKLPITMGKKVFRVWCEAFREHGSVKEAMVHLKNALRLHFQEEASFLPLLLSPSFMKREKEYAEVDEYANVTGGSRSAPQYCLVNLRTKASFIDHVYKDSSKHDENPPKIPLDTIKYWLELSLHYRRYIAAIYFLIKNLLIEFIPDAFSPESSYSLLEGLCFRMDPMVDAVDKVCDILEQASVFELIRVLISWKCSLSGQRNSAEANDALRSDYPPVANDDDKIFMLIENIDKYTVLLGAIPGENGGAKRTSLALQLAHWLESQITEVLFLDDSNDLPMNDFFYISNDTAVANAIKAQPRREVSEQLQFPAHVIKCSCCTSGICNTMPDTCIAFKTHNERVVDGDQWYADFRSVLIGERKNQKRNKKHTTAHDPGQDDEMWNRFAFSVYELQQCGLIKWHSSGRKRGKFEKEAMVWASGK